MPDDMRDDEIVDEMPATGNAPCGQIFGAEAEYVTDADDDDDMPAPGGGHCGDPFASTQVIHVTDADDA
jgi:hypothetical protein